MKRAFLPALILTLACTAAPSPTPAPASAPAPVRNPEFRNVQVLPHTMSRDELLEVMRRFTQGLGVRCDHCHVVTATTPRQQFDFGSDEKESKRVAREMIRMAQEINGPWMERVEAIEGHEADSHQGEAMSQLPRVNCWTCHRGKTEPEMPPPLPPRQ